MASAPATLLSALSRYRVLEAMGADTQPLVRILQGRASDLRAESLRALIVPIMRKTADSPVTNSSSR